MGSFLVYFSIAVKVLFYDIYIVTCASGVYCGKMIV